MKNITSRQNPTIRLYRRLLHEKKARDEEGAFVIEGPKLASEALRSGCEPVSAIVTESACKKYIYIIEMLTQKCEIFVINDAIAEYISDTKTPQGIFLELKALDKRINSDTIDRNSRFLVLDRLQDPGNIGTIIRTAEALGIDGLFLSDDCGDFMSPKTVRAAMGSLFRLPLYVAPLSESIPMLKNSGYKIFGAMLDESAVRIYDADFSGKCAMVIGNEGNGISEITQGLLDVRVYIPINTAESLNAAAAASILGYEMCKK